MKISQRVIDILPSPIRKLSDIARQTEDSGITVYHLNIGQPDIETPDLFINAIQNYTEKVIAYSPSQGLPSYIKALVKYYNKLNLNVSAEDIIVTTGGSEAISFAFFSVMDTDDEVIIPEPFYANYNGFASYMGVNIVPITTSIETNFSLPDISVFEEKITEKTKAILICNPNNPTGKIYSDRDLEKIVFLSKKYGLYVISDDAYREFDHTRIVKSILNFPGMEEHTIIVDSISKRVSACGARIGALVTKRKDIIQNVMKVAQARLCPPMLGQIGAIAISNMPVEYYEKTMKEYRRRIDTVCNALDEIPELIYHRPEGAFYLIARLPVKDSDDFCEFLLRDFYSINPITGKKETVMFAPASGFYKTPDLGKNEIRIAAVLKREFCRRGIEILKEGLEKYKEKK